MKAIELRDMLEAKNAGLRISTEGGQLVVECRHRTSHRMTGKAIQPVTLVADPFILEKTIEEVVNAL
jgi:hypothetical protein